VASEVLLSGVVLVVSRRGTFYQGPLVGEAGERIMSEPKVAHSAKNDAHDVRPKKKRSGARTAHYKPCARGRFRWFRLTREEGVWIVPAVGLMVFLAAFRVFKDRWHLLRNPRASLGDQWLRGLAMATSIVIGVFITTQIAFESVICLRQIRRGGCQGKKLPKGTARNQ
jgi:hypothetical protein